MKRLKFHHKFVDKILSRAKISTMRLFDDKNLQVGDQLELVDSSTGNVFACAEILELREKLVKQLSPEELAAHNYENVEAMIESHRGYYGDKVSRDTVTKIITFKLK